jgi:hypothetical protein
MGLDFVVYLSHHGAEHLWGDYQELDPTAVAVAVVRDMVLDVADEVLGVLY